MSPSELVPVPQTDGSELGILRGDGEALARILALVAASSGRDFSEYRRPTLERRLASRMKARSVEQLPEYLKLLEREPEELELLWHSWLIQVSSFFRDPEAYEALFERGLAPLIRAKPAGEPLRIWVAACAAGEEAYSIAIGVMELMERENKQLPVRIYATDLSPAAIARARRGSYPLGIQAHVSGARLKRFFAQSPTEYRVHPWLRRLIVFGNHDLLRDFFFRHLDLVSCRNLLIYLKPPAQQQVLRGFAESLVPGGLLWMGATESLGRCASHFHLVDKRARLYRKI